MSIPKMILVASAVLFGVIALAALYKKGPMVSSPAITEVVATPIEIELSPEAPQQEPQPKRISLALLLPPVQKEEAVSLLPKEDALDNVDRIEEFFNKREPRLPIVETITYKSRVPWLKGRQAWVADYASHYKTSRHFIARSLNGRPDYERQNVNDGVRFNVLNDEKNFEFYLLVDLLSGKMRFYYIDNDNGEKVLLKTYRVGVGRPDPVSPSGSLTPLGKYTLGSKVAVYKPKVVDHHQGQKTEMVRVFGTRWIPFEEEIGSCTASAKGYGLHGLPLLPNDRGEMVENPDDLQECDSDGCIRMATKDIEELFAIIISRPATIEIVKGFPKY